MGSVAFTGCVPREPVATEIHTVPIHDLRPLAESLSLDREGFVLRHAPTAVADLYDDVAVETAYYAEIEALVKRVLGANRAVIFDAPPRSDADSGAAHLDGAPGPAGRVPVARSEARSAGNECVRTCKSLWTPSTKTKQAKRSTPETTTT